MRVLGFIWIIISFPAVSQDYPKDFFRMPVDTEVSLSGNFAEIRHDHFHYGWDIRTGGKEGLKILAAGEGYVSRIKVSPYGYGKVIYITHPNGYVTVYAHLSAFNDSIGAYVKKGQYENKSFEVELFPKAGELPVKKGEFIALSGNSGFSEAPHLHFEIRDEKTEEVINPYLFGLKVKDQVKPVFKTLGIYAMGSGDQVNGSLGPEYISLKNKNGTWEFSSPDSVVVWGRVGFGVDCSDSETGSSGINQVYSLEFQLDGKRIYYYEMKRFAFDQSLFVNCHIDYKAQRKDRKNIQRAFLLPGNKFPAYDHVVNSGIVHFDSTAVHTGTFIARDFFGNTSSFTFMINARFKQRPLRPDKSQNDVYEELGCRMVPGNREMEYVHADSGRYIMSIPPHSFYEDTAMVNCPDGKKNLKLPGIYSLPFTFPGKYVPIHNKYTLRLKTDTVVPDSLTGKLLIGMLDEKGKFISKGGEYKDGWVTTQTRSFGTFAVIMDSTAPAIKEPKLPKGNSITALKKVEFKIYDNLSGIKNYRVTLDGKWVLFEYEPKNKSLFCRTSDLPAGKHTLKVVVTDEKGNERVEWLTYTK